MQSRGLTSLTNCIQSSKDDDDGVVPIYTNSQEFKINSNIQPGEESNPLLARMKIHQFHSRNFQQQMARQFSYNESE